MRKIIDLLVEMPITVPGSLQQPGILILSMKYSPDGNWFASGTTNHKVVIWNTATWTQSEILQDFSYPG
jgi:hypothetical protein